MAAQLCGGQDPPLYVGQVVQGAGGERGVVVHAPGFPAPEPPSNRCYTVVDKCGQGRPKVRTFDCRKALVRTGSNTGYGSEYLYFVTTWCRPSDKRKDRLARRCAERPCESQAPVRPEAGTTEGTGRSRCPHDAVPCGGAGDGPPDRPAGSPSSELTRPSRSAGAVRRVQPAAAMSHA
ncbi:hypothetical protein GCM10023335_09600 [Streptomyces siamensis]|uniref:Uncharacterized protein n=1 Tax=Streptomyces siamensis TaxID=1274986 RepID=A0ABP9IHL7_9ACTN